MLPRDPWRLLVAPFRLANYRTVVRSVRTFERPWAVLYRYITNRGSYPYELGLKTPTGRLVVTVPSFHDLRTVNEIFNRGDYATSVPADVVVDLGANIGISALYFLTRNLRCRVYCYEPAPQNLPRLRATLAPFADRVVINSQAVSDRRGLLEFNAEPVGRYSGLLHGNYTEPVVNVIRVETIHVDEALEAVLAREAKIDLVKIDTEGTELAITRAIRLDLLEQIDEIAMEATPTEPLFPGRFSQSDSLSGVCWLRNLRTVAPSEL